MNSSNYSASNHFQADINDLSTILRSYKSDEFNSEKRSLLGSVNRGRARDEILEQLKKGVVLALSKVKLGDNIYGHFFAVYKIDYQPDSSTGGTVYFFDPIPSRGFGTQDFSTFLTNMGNSGGDANG